MRRAVVVVLIAVASSCTTPSIIATRNIQKGDEMNNANRYAESIVYYEDYLKMAPQLGLYRNPLKESEVSRKLAHAYATQGKYRQATRYAGKALSIDSLQRDNRLNIIEDYRLLGVINAFSGDYFNSQTNLSHSLQLSEGMEASMKDKKRFSVADTHLALAQVQLSTGDFKECEQNVTRALALYNGQTEKTFDIMEGQLVLGIIEREKGNLEQAIRWLKESQKAAEQAQVNKARQNQAMGEVLFLRGEWEEGLRSFQSALDEAERSQIKPQIVMANIRVGDTYQRMGDHERANQYYRKALLLQQAMKEDSSALLPSLDLRLGNVQEAYDKFKGSGSSMGMALASLRLTEMLQERNRMDSAELMAQKALAFFSGAGSKEGEARVYFQLGLINAATQNQEKAVQYFKISLGQTSQVEIKWKCWYELGRLFEIQNIPDSARYAFRKSIGIIEQQRGNLSVEEFKTLFSASNVSVYDRLILLLQRNQNKWRFSADSALVEAFDMNERARSRTFLDMLGNNKIQAKSTGDKALLEEEQLLRLKIQQLGKELLKSHTNQEMYVRLKKELTESELGYHNLLEKIKLNNPAYEGITSVSPPSLKQVQSILDQKTLLVEYWVSKEETILWLIDREKIHVERIHVGESQLNREIAYTRQVMASQLEPESSAALKRLHDVLVKPVLSARPGYRKWIVVPHKSLHFLPFEALQDDQGKFLVEQGLIINYVPSSGVLHYCANRKAEEGNKFLGLAMGAEAISGFPGLPGTELELKQLALVYPGLTRRTRGEFTESFLKKNISQFNYTHIATHGVFNGHQPLYSYILMSGDDQEDGQLSVHEIFGLNINSRLVTLSACETGLGKVSSGDELVGLSRAFIYGGAPAVVVSLWKVDDQTTVMLMARFYQYLNSGKSTSESLALAKLDVLTKNFAPPSLQRGTPLEEEVIRPIRGRDHETIRKPYYWAAFVVIGNGMSN